MKVCSARTFQRNSVLLLLQSLMLDFDMTTVPAWFHALMSVFTAKGTPTCRASGPARIHAGEKAVFLTDCTETSHTVYHYEGNQKTVLSN